MRHVLGLQCPSGTVADRRPRAMERRRRSGCVVEAVAAIERHALLVCEFRELRVLFLSSSRCSRLGPFTGSSRRPRGVRITSRSTRAGLRQCVRVTSCRSPPAPGRPPVRSTGRSPRSFGSRAASTPRSPWRASLRTRTRDVCASSSASASRPPRRPTAGRCPRTSSGSSKSATGQGPSAVGDSVRHSARRELASLNRPRSQGRGSIQVGDSARRGNGPSRCHERQLCERVRRRIGLSRTTRRRSGSATVPDRSRTDRRAHRGCDRSRDARGAWRGRRRTDREAEVAARVRGAGRPEGLVDQLRAATEDAMTLASHAPRLPGPLPDPIAPPTASRRHPQAVRSKSTRQHRPVGCNRPNCR
jgi:hypothetical protein